MLAAYIIKLINSLLDSNYCEYYAGQWGLPTVSLGAVFGMLAGVLAGSYLSSLSVQKRHQNTAVRYYGSTGHPHPGLVSCHDGVGSHCGVLIGPRLSATTF